MKLKRVTGVTLLALGMALSMGSSAQGTKPAETGWYVGGSLGQSDAKDACEGLSGTGISCDDTDTTWKILGGYQLNRNFAAELGYSDLGKAKASGFGINAEIETTAWELVGLGSFPLTNQFSIYGKLGLYRAETELSSNVGVSADETNTDLTYGFGVRFDFARNFGVRAEWQRYTDVGGGDIGESDADVMSVGIVFRF